MSTISISDIRVSNKSDSYAAWKANNPTLLLGEIGMESDTFRQKIGDGSTAWNDLPYTNYTEITGIAVDTSTALPFRICSLPAEFYLNRINIKVEEGWSSAVNFSVGTESDHSWIFSEDDFDPTDEGSTFTFQINEKMTEPTALYLYKSGGLSATGKLTINIK